MKDRYYTLFLCWMLVCLSSCEMKNELWSKEQTSTSDEAGILDLKLEVKVPSYSEIGITKAEENTLIAPKVEDMIVKVFNESMELQDYFASYSDYLKQSEYVLEKGVYYIEAYSGENYEITSNYPYYELLDTCEIKAKEVTLVNAVCELQSAILYLVPTDVFLNACTDDYAIVITNGTGVLTVRKGDSGIVYIRPGLKTTVTIRATEKKSGTPVIRTFELADSSGKVNPQDLFKIEIKDLEEDIIPEEPTTPDPEEPEDPEPTEPTTPDPEEPEKPSKGNFTIKVDVTLNENPIDIVVPSTGGNDSGSSGGDDNTSDGGSDSDGITITGDAINTDLTVNAPNGISSFEVTIDSPLLPESDLQSIGLTSNFDLVSPGVYAEKLSALGFPVGDQVKDKTSVSFNISTFVPLIKILGSGTSNFHLKVTDSKGNTKSYTITVTT